VTDSPDETVDDVPAGRASESARSGDVGPGDPGHAAHARRNVRLYPWYAAAIHSYFWLPVFFLYFLEHMPLEQVLRLEAIYYLGVFLLEVPSGYFSDRLGRRPTLLIASVCLVFAYVMFFVADGFAMFVGAQLFLAAGLAFNSGTDTTLHLESLIACGRKEDYAQREAAVARNGILASGLAGLLGGAAGMIGLRYAYGLCIVTGVVAVVLVVLMREPGRSDGKRLPGSGLTRQLCLCFGFLRMPVLAWVFGYYVVMTILNHVPYEFYQPYLKLAMDQRWEQGQGTSFASGVHIAVVMVVASVFASYSVKLRDRIGLGPVLLVATALQTLIILAMGWAIHPLIVLLIVMRSVPRALMSAPINAAVAPRVPRAQRATFLSLMSLAGRLAFAAFLLGLSLLPVAEDGGSGWAELSQKLLIAAAFGGVALIALAMTSGLARSRGAETASDPGADPGD